MSDESIRNWYQAPLSTSDLLAGGILILLSTLFLTIYIPVICVLWGASKEIIGFRYLLSSSAAHILCMVQYGILNGVAILSKNPLVSREGRSGLHLYMDWVWFSSCFHLPLVAWTRLHAIYSPHSFRKQTQWMSYLACGALVWLISLIICCSTHWQPFYVTCYIEPAAYGTVISDFHKYQRDGHAQMFLGIHIFVFVLPLLFYSSTIALLIKQRSMAGVGTALTKSSRTHSVETRLIVPCILEMMVFAIGQVALTMTSGSSPWTTWSMNFLFFLNAALQPVLLIIFSPFLRNGILSLLHLRKSAKTAPKLVLTTVSETRAKTPRSAQSR